MKRHFAVGHAALAFLLSCGNPSKGPLTPDLPTFAGVDPERARVSVQGKRTEPFVIDWKSEQRADLEIAVREGPAIVRFDAQSLELLPDCHATGSYTYNGVDPKKEEKIWRSRAELAMNLPVGWATMEGHLKEDGQVRVAIFVVGKHRLSGEVRRDQLAGRCTGATHVVRRMTVGAFRFVAGATRSAGGSVGAFGAGVSGGGEGEAGSMTSDGDFTACDGANPDSGAAPAKCRAVLQIQLEPLDGGPPVVAAPPTAGAPPPDERPDCGEGLRWDGSACVEVSRVKAEEEAARAKGQASGDAATTTSTGFECDPKNVSECQEQCLHRNMASCTHLGWSLVAGSNGAAKDEQKALALWDVACSQKEARGCAALNIYWTERGDYRKALVYGAAGCHRGDAGSCTNVAVQAFFGRGTSEDRPAALKLWARACGMGDANACNNAGVMLLHGMGGVPKSVDGARKLFERACVSPGREGCANLGTLYELGLGVGADADKALKLYLQGCEHNGAVACVSAGLVLEEKSNKPERLGAAQKFYEQACALPPGGGCLTDAELRQNFPGAWSDEGFDRRSCEGADQNALACYNAGIGAERGYAGQVDTGKAAEYLKKACDAKLQKACRSPRPGAPRKM